MVLRKYEHLYQRLSILEAGDIFQETKCLKPCTYRDYRFVTFGVMFQTSIHAPSSYNSSLTIQNVSLKTRFIGGSETTSFGAKDFTFSLWAVSNDTTIEREVKISLSI